MTQMLVDLFKRDSEVLNEEMLFKGYSMILNGRLNLEVVGGYRTHEEAHYSHNSIPS
jgi:hypothetical protein